MGLGLVCTGGSDKYLRGWDPREPTVAGDPSAVPRAAFAVNCQEVGGHYDELFCMISSPNQPYLITGASLPLPPLVHLDRKKPYLITAAFLPPPQPQGALHHPHWHLLVCTLSNLNEKLPLLDFCGSST